MMSKDNKILIKEGQKFCTKCRKLKPLSDFYRHKKKRFGVEYMCKECTRKYDRERWKSDRKEVLNDMGGKCVYCGCSIYEALEINHKYGGGSQEHEQGRIIRSIKFRRRKTDDLEVTCGVCNAWHRFVKLDGIPDGWTITWKDPDV